LDPDIECQLQIRNLSEDAAEDDLRALFAQFGDVLAVMIIRDPQTGASRGYGYATMSAQSEADTAVSRLDGRPFFGRPLRVGLVKARTMHADYLT
jgi:RNA recognition motif-containing protein